MMYKIMMKMPGDLYPTFVRYEEDEERGRNAVKILNRSSKLAKYFLWKITGTEMSHFKSNRRKIRK